MTNNGREQQPDFLPAPIPANERDRIAALRAFDILDSAEEDIFNSITKAAADVCKTKMASITFVDENRQWFKSKIGLAICETPRDPAFCAHAINGSDLFLVSDTLNDDRFRNNPLVIDNPRLRFYAGMPLLTSSGLALGTLCVLDTVPKSLDEYQARALITLASSAMRVLELRRNMGVAVFAKAVDLTSDGVTIAVRSADTLSIMYSNESFLKMTGLQYLETIDLSPLLIVDSPSSQAKEAFAEATSTRQMRTVECPFRRKDGELRWARISFVPYVDDNNDLLYLVTVYHDITAVKEAEAQVQQLHAMRTTIASVAHVMKNFLNASQLYAFHVDSQFGVDARLQRPFEEALEQTRSQLAAIDRMESFKDRPTPFGFSVLDTDAEPE